MTTNIRGTSTRQRILDVAQDAVLSKGFEATSIDEIVAAVEITKGGFFYHFPDKNALARALIDRYIDEENRIFDDLFGRARDLTDDPLQTMLVGLKLLAELFEDLPGGHPGCLIATACYQDRLFDADVREINRRAILGWRARFGAMFREIADRYPPRAPVDCDALGDMLSGICEGAIIVAKATRQPQVLPQQVLLFREMVRVVFQPLP
jgi:TetR/AcrR family transcriptional regulator, transcriptional repressor for nem operon